MNELFHNTVRKRMKMRTGCDNIPLAGRTGGREVLAQVLGDLGFNRGAEIGVRAGEYSLALCQANPQIELFCVDPWLHPVPSRQHRSERYLRRAKAKLEPFNATIIRKTSMEALADFENDSLDFVYIDADHTFDCVCMDIIGWSKKVRSGGIVAGHDYYQFYRGGVVAAVDAYTRCHDIRPWYVTLEETPSWFWEKP